MKDDELSVYMFMWRDLESFLHEVVRDSLPDLDQALDFLKLICSIKCKYKDV